MVVKNKKVNPIVLRRGVGIGTGNAESDDEFLFDCFVEYPPVESALRLQSPTMILSGRTGSGKTAILRHLEAVTEHHVSIDPFEMSMGYVSNSDALRFLASVGADLDLFFQVLWKHVLCIEFIRLRFNVLNEQRSRSIFDKIKDRFGKDQRRSRSLAYLQDWQNKFWITMDENIKEVTESVERKLHAEVGADIERFKAGGQYDKRLSTERKSEIVARTRKIISSDQLTELHGIIDMLSNIEEGQMKAFYMLIDRLDERWVDDSVRFRMIKGLIESLKSFRKITNLKILVALRADVLERVVQETADVSFQREKFEDNTSRLVWSRNDLELLVERRIAALFKRQYTSHEIHFADIFPEKVGAVPTFQWMLQRTLMRPRDIIAFVNECFDAADGRSEISVSHIRKAEVEYARKRKDALVQEWASSFPSMKRMLDFAASLKKTTFTLSEFTSDQIDELALGICSDGKSGYDPIFDHCQSYLDGKTKDQFALVQSAMAILYRAGAIGLKLNEAEQMTYSHLHQPLISMNLIQPSTRAKLVPMLHAAFHLHEAT